MSYAATGQATALILAKERQLQTEAMGEPRPGRLEAAIAATTVIPITDSLITQVAELRHACQLAGHPLASSAHANDLWIAASTIHVRAKLVTADRLFTDVPGLDLLT